MIRLRQRHSAMPLLRSLGYFLVNVSIDIPPLRGLGKPPTPNPQHPSYCPRSTMRLISAFAWFIASSAVSSPLFAFDK